MIKSYQGAFTMKSKAPQEQQAVTVADYMATKLITFSPHQTMQEAMETLLKHKISGAPVVDEDGSLIGVVSEGDCLKEIVRGKYNNTPSLPALVSDYMATEVISITPDKNIFEAANTFLRLRFRRFPVIENGKLVGQIIQRDIMRAVSKMKETSW
jgi:predicted transcriptional regulator